MSDPRITDEMVSDANVAYWKAFSLDSTQDLNDDGAEQAVAIRAALEAALPLLALQVVVDRDGLRKQIAQAIRDHVYVLDGHSEVSGSCKCGENHGYSQDLNQADAVLALLNGGAK